MLPAILRTRQASQAVGLPNSKRNSEMVAQDDSLRPSSSGMLTHRRKLHMVEPGTRFNTMSSYMSAVLRTPFHHSPCSFVPRRTLPKRLKLGSRAVTHGQSPKSHEVVRFGRMCKLTCRTPLQAPARSRHFWGAVTTQGFLCHRHAREMLGIAKEGLGSGRLHGSHCKVWALCE